MAIKDCVEEIRKISGSDLSDEDIRVIAEEIDRRAKYNRAKNKLLSEKDALDQAAQEYTTDADMAAKMAARNQAINILTRKRLFEFVKEAEAHGIKPDEAIDALNVGTNKRFPGSRASVDSRTMALHGEFMGGMIADLEREGLWEFMSRRLGMFGRDAGVLDRDIAKALWSIGEDGKATADVSVQARRIAEIVHKWQDAARLRSNRAGSFIRDLPGYIMRQAHDSARIVKAGRADWTNFVKPLLDPEKTFGGSDPDEFLKGAYSALSSGVHVKSQGAVSDLAFKGSANLAKKLSQERVLHFKDAESFLAYNERFGTRSLIEGIFSGLQRSARDIALMETWGTNPRAMFDDVRGALAYQHRDDMPNLNTKIHSDHIENGFKEVDGSTIAVDNPQIAQWASGARALQSMTKLGSSTLSSIPDVATAAAELRWQGHNLGSAYVGVLASLLHGRGTAEGRALAAEIGVGIEGALGEVAARFSGHDNLPGKASRLMRLYFKANLLSWWTDAIKSGAGKMMAWRAAEQAGRGWSRLDPRFRDAISMYGIDEKRWEVIRTAKQKGDGGRNYLTPDGVRSLPDTAFAPLGGRAQDHRDNLATALQQFYVDRTDYAVITPGARERAFLHQGLQRGTWKGEALRFITQFKTFPVAFATKAIGRELNGLGIVQGLLKGKGDLLGLAHLVAATTAMGMIALSAKEIVKGRRPEDPFDQHWANAWTSAMLQGGGLGFYGDYLLGNFQGYGASPLESAAGPFVTNISDAIKLWSDFRTGQKGTAGEAIRFARDNTPGLNLFYTKLAFDYLVLYSLQEMASPGYLRRSEQNLKRNTGQTYFVPPSSVVH